MPDPAYDESAATIHFLMYNVDARDGVSRAVLTMANELARVRRVEIISVYCRNDGPAYAISERIRVTYLFDHQPALVPADKAAPRPVGPPYTRWPVTRHPVRNLIARRRSRLTLGYGFPNMSLLTDRALRRALTRIRSGIVVSTRPVLHMAAVQLVGPDVITVGQDHINFLSRTNETGSLELIEKACGLGLGALVTLTEDDAVDYTRLLAGKPTRVVAIPNALSWPVSPAPAHDHRVVVTAGRLVPRKAIGRLIQAFAPVARRHPDWKLKIYGEGPMGQRLAELIVSLEMSQNITLEGHTDHLQAAFEDANIFASSSRAEGFPMVMLEALSKGLPLVGFDCPRGPSDIIRTGHNGILVPNHDIGGLSVALETLIGDADMRRAMGAQALLDAEAFRPEHIATRWLELFAELSAPARA
ncbi:MAG: putative glycosyl transferase, group 1 [Marmoricola sp.]|nr:putative glycosyl transferase, group 1 [Marmoricola sp.]